MLLNHYYYCHIFQDVASYIDVNTCPESKYLFLTASMTISCLKNFLWGFRI